MPTAESGVNTMVRQCSVQYQVINSCSEKCFDRGPEIEGCSSGEERSASSGCHSSGSIVVCFPPGCRVIVVSCNGMEASGVCRIIEGHRLQSNVPLWWTT
jgi:hypothetical protein